MPPLVILINSCLGAALVCFGSRYDQAERQRLATCYAVNDLSQITSDGVNTPTTIWESWPVRFGQAQSKLNPLTREPRPNSFILSFVILDVGFWNPRACGPRGCLRESVASATIWLQIMRSLLLYLQAVGIALILSLAGTKAWCEAAPVRFAIVGLVHDHARGFIPAAITRKDIELAAIVEPDQDLARRYARDYKLGNSLFYTNLEQMLEATKVQAVATFTSTFEHRRVVETCAARGVHVMMEKPLAVSMEHARAIQNAARRGRIEVLVNYETTWYPANQETFQLVHDQKAIGELRKLVVHDGHQGPKEIGCSADFLRWLTDPVLNGGGALTDFGCYGADLITWLLKGERPISVFAVTQQIKPQVYPKVDDEATIVLTYPHCQGIIQASWNWPFNRKDMEVYGQTGYVLAPEKSLLRVRTAGAAEKEITPQPLSVPNNDPLSYLAAVVRGDIRPAGLSSLEVNLIVTEILDAARQSARTGKRVALNKRG